MGKAYDDSRFAVTKFLTFPGHCDLINAAGNVSQMTFDEDIILIEFGVIMTETMNLTAASTATVQLREGSTVLGVITLATGSTIGSVYSTRTLTTTAIDAGNTLIFYQNVSTVTIGECDGYVTYRERFKSG